MKVARTVKNFILLFYALVMEWVIVNDVSGSSE
jgi:hypothetical protein